MITGFMLYDRNRKKRTVLNTSPKIFYPASDTKIFAFYTSLVVLEILFPTLTLPQTNDSLIFQVPEIHHPVWEHFDPGKTFSFLSTTNKSFSWLMVILLPMYLDPVGRWDDLVFTYSFRTLSLCRFMETHFTLPAIRQQNKTTPSYFSFDVTVRDSTDKSACGKWVPTKWTCTRQNSV